MQPKDILEPLAKLGLPLLGAMLPIPGGAAIGTALASAIGAPSGKPEDILATLQASGDAVLKAKQFEAENRTKMMELTLAHETAMYQAEVDDRKSARQAATDTKAYTPAVLSWLVVIGTFLMYGYLLKFGNPKELDDVILGRILGTLDVAFATVLAFWLGTSFSSRKKDDTIDSLAKQ